MVKKLDELFALVKNNKKKTLVVAVAQDKEVLLAVHEAVELGIVDAILIGNRDKIEDIAEKNNIDISKMKVIKEINENLVAKKAAELVAKGEADFIMKGMINTQDFIDQLSELKGKNMLSHILVYDIPNYHKLLFLTDGGMISYPNLQEKATLINNSVFVAQKLDIKMPKVAVACATEIINETMSPTMDAAQLVVMNERGQIKNCIVDGPLGLDNAINKEAAERKGIKSEVAGDADIILVPNIESGNFLGKSLTYFSGAESAGVVVGAKCPIVLVSRADSAKTKLFSIALASILS